MTGWPLALMAERYELSAHPKKPWASENVFPTALRITV